MIRRPSNRSKILVTAQDICLALFHIREQRQLPDIQTVAREAGCRQVEAESLLANDQSLAALAASIRNNSGDLLAA